MGTYDERPLHSSWRHRLLSPSPRLLAQPAVQSILLRSFVLCLDSLAHRPRGTICIFQTRSKILLSTSCAHNFTTSLASRRTFITDLSYHFIHIIYTMSRMWEVDPETKAKVCFWPSFVGEIPDSFGTSRFQPLWLTLLANCHL